MTEQGQEIVYENIDDEFMNHLLIQLQQEIIKMSDLVSKGKDELIRYYISKGNGSWQVNGEATAAYFGMTLEDFPGHRLFDVK